MNLRIPANVLTGADVPFVAMREGRASAAMVVRWGPSAVIGADARR